MNQRNEVRHDLAGMLWGPDWWARLMAFGSLLVAAAALWVARNPDVPSTASNDTANSVATSGQLPGLDDTPDVDGSDQAADSESPDASETLNRADTVNRVRPATHEEQAKTTSEASMSGLGYAAANASSHNVDPAGEVAAEEEPATTAEDALIDLAGHAVSSDGKETTALRANELLEGGEDVFRGKDFLTAEELESETKLVDVPPASDDVDSSASEAADSAPSLTRDSFSLDGNKFEQSGLVVVSKESQPLKTEFAVTMKLRNTSDRSIVISRVLFRPREIIENVSTDFASRPFGVSSSSEFVLAFVADDNLSEDPATQGRYDRRLSVPDTFKVFAGGYC